MYVCLSFSVAVGINLRPPPQREREEGGGGEREREREREFVGCLTSHQHASVSQGRICTDNFTSCHTEIEVVDKIFYFTQLQHTDTGPTSPSADPLTPGTWQYQFLSHWYDSTRKIHVANGIRIPNLPLSRRTP